MNLERALMQIFRMISRRLINRGLHAGVDHLARGGKQEQDLTPAQKAEAQRARQTAKQARQAARLLRRLR